MLHRGRPHATALGRLELRLLDTRTMDWLSLLVIRALWGDGTARR